MNQSLIFFPNIIPDLITDNLIEFITPGLYPITYFPLTTTSPPCPGRKLTHTPHVPCHFSLPSKSAHYLLSPTKSSDLPIMSYKLFVLTIKWIPSKTTRKLEFLCPFVTSCRILS